FSPNEPPFGPRCSGNDWPPAVDFRCFSIASRLWSSDATRMSETPPAAESQLCPVEPDGVYAPGSLNGARVLLGAPPTFRQAVPRLTPTFAGEDRQGAGVGRPHNV